MFYYNKLPHHLYRGSLFHDHYQYSSYAGAKSRECSKFADGVDPKTGAKPKVTSSSSLHSTDRSLTGATGEAWVGQALFD